MLSDSMGWRVTKRSLQLFGRHGIRRLIGILSEKAVLVEKSLEMLELLGAVEDRIALAVRGEIHPIKRDRKSVV